MSDRRQDAAQAAGAETLHANQTESALTQNPLIFMPIGGHNVDEPSTPPGLAERCVTEICILASQFTGGLVAPPAQVSSRRREPDACRTLAATDAIELVASLLMLANQWRAERIVVVTVGLSPDIVAAISAQSRANKDAFVFDVLSDVLAPDLSIAPADEHFLAALATGLELKPDPSSPEIRPADGLTLAVEIVEWIVEQVEMAG